MKIHNMTFSKLFLAVISLVALISCEKKNSGDLVQKTFEYEEFPSNLEESVNSVCFIDDKNGFATGNGNILKTTDGGLTWDSDSISDLPLNSICFVDSKIGYAVGGKSSCGGTGCTVPGSIVYKTNDSGENWIKLDIPYEWSELNSVSFVDENTGFATGLGLHIKTLDGGETWDQFEFEYQGSMKKVSFINSQTGICAGLFGNIFKTSNQGDSWIKSDNESDGHIYDFCFVDENTGYAGGQKEIVKTIDGGETWNILPYSPTEIYFIHFANQDNGIAIGKGHYTGGDFGTWTKALYRTNDGGKTWDVEDNIEFGYAVSFYNNNNGYAIMPDKTFKITYK